MYEIESFLNVFQKHQKGEKKRYNSLKDKTIKKYEDK